MHKLWRLAAECLVASFAVLLLTVVCYRMHLNLATASLLYVIVIVLVSRTWSSATSIVASIVAALGLAHLAPPAFSFRVNDPLDVVAISAFLLTSWIIARLMYRVRKQTEDALSSVSNTVIEAEEQERHRIASDLHEDIGQRLTLLTIETEQLEADAANPMVDVPSRMHSVRKQTLEILADVKFLAHELHSPRLQYLGIAAVMSSFCKEFGERKRVEIDVRSEGIPSFVPPDVALCLFRVLQEALHNAGKHSGVRHFDVQLSGSSDEIHLTVSDCGVGFSLATAKTGRGLGLNRMQERLKLVKGSLSIDSQPKRGTTIHARVPFTSSSHSALAAQ
ncbi:MAG TPA: sensor histidine kinase [Candidatus Acidoferrum sp.]|nr:sensor histidine kinase [Candidatus Acidoferrum sp.]